VGDGDEASKRRDVRKGRAVQVRAVGKTKKERGKLGSSHGGGGGGGGGGGRTNKKPGQGKKKKGGKR
jgi:hypothetical protein